MTVVCIAGMHRSGTSMVARLLNLCGVYLGEEDDLLPASDENPEGFWENLAFLEINEEILARLQAGWDFPAPMPVGWESRPDLQPLRLKAAQLIQQFSPHERWAWKDPRNSITLPFWLELIPGLKVVTCLRNPLEVARSLRNRNYFSAAASYDLWLAYNQRLLQSLDRGRQIITHVDAYRKDAQAELKRILDLLGLSVSGETIEAATRAVTRPLLHQRAGLEELVTAHPPAGVVELYEEMCALAGPVFQSSLDEPWPEEPPPGGAYRTYVRNRRAAELQATVTEQDKMLHDLDAQLAGSEQSVQALTVRLAERELTLRDLNADLADADQSLRDLKGYLDEVQSSIGWRVLAVFWEARARLIPRGSKREQWLRSLLHLGRSPGNTDWSRSVAPTPDQGILLEDSPRASAPAFSGAEPPPLFDASWYLTQYPAARDAGISPYEHYQLIGASRGYNPNPLFETTRYAKAHGLAAADALVHFQDSDSLLETGAYRTADVLVMVQRLNQLSTQTTCIADRRSRERRFAVYLQCGSGSAHPQWLRDEPRPWDLVVNHYDATYLGRIPCDVEFRQEGALPGTKFTSFAALLDARSNLTSAYDFWLLLDDDVVFSPPDIARLFAIAQENALDLAQASLSADSYCAHPVFKHSGGGGLRFVNAVEIMMPLISRRALRVGAHLFNETISGWGLDVAFGDLVQRTLQGKAAIIDQVVARHARPIDVENGALYRMLHAAWIFPQIELSHLQRIYGVGRQFVEQAPLGTV